MPILTKARLSSFFATTSHAVNRRAVPTNTSHFTKVNKNFSIPSLGTMVNVKRSFTSHMPLPVWSNGICARMNATRQEIVQHDFHVELIKKKLHTEKISLYLAIDCQYLDVFAQSLKNIAKHPSLTSSQQSFLEKCAQASLEDIKTINGNFDTEPFSTCQTLSLKYYTEHLRIACYQPCLVIALAAILPCFWVYRAIGEEMIKHQSTGQKHDIHTKLMALYVSKSNRSWPMLQNMIDNLAKNTSPIERNKMNEAFVTSVNCEFNLVNDAYCQNITSWNIIKPYV
jgi:thiaminase (transcriptional activator TenA)